MKKYSVLFFSLVLAVTFSCQKNSSDPGDDLSALEKQNVEAIESILADSTDLAFDGISITVTDTTATNNGQSFVDYVRNRKNSSGWVTTGSNDAANTTLVVELGDSKDLDLIALIGHNLKAYTIQYWNGSSYVDFSTAISETANTSYNNYHSFDTVRTNKFRIV